VENREPFTCRNRSPVNHVMRNELPNAARHISTLVEDSREHRPCTATSVATAVVQSVNFEIRLRARSHERYKFCGWATVGNVELEQIGQNLVFTNKPLKMISNQFAYWRESASILGLGVVVGDDIECNSLKG
jgi:hypothetical protein